jgi:asparagine synthase (glutamine-hydrolysing)
VCGLGGWFGELAVDPAAGDRMAAALRHRGPDGSGCDRFEHGTLVHTRLRIIDLSPLADQPMANEDGSVQVVYNGEIYNHHELRRALESAGHVFRTSTDTEVLPHLWEEHGPGMFALLRGMFAVAVLDRRQGVLALARDRFGIKPLFHAAVPGGLAFASEIPALLALPGVDRTPDRQAIADYTAILCVPAPRTMYAGIRALEPGTCLVARQASGGVETAVHAYHGWSPATADGLTLEEAADRAEALVERAVRSQLESDVPLGAMLSGGIDSSLLAWAAQRGLAGELHTFNVATPDPAYDESQAARSVADALGTRHTQVAMDAGPAGFDEVTAVFRSLGQPFADTSLFGVSAVSGAMRRHVTVALSGDGGDEGFGGYDLYHQLHTIARLQRLPAPGWRAAAVLAGPLARRGLVSPTMPKRMRDLAGADDTTVVQTLFSWLRASEQRELLVDAGSVAPARHLFERRWPSEDAGGSRTDRLAAHAVEANVRLILPNDFLFKVDAASMRHSLEVRVPFLDEELVDFGLSLPRELRVRGTVGKPVLREVARRHLPGPVAAKPKQGFAIPVDRWLGDDVRAAARESLLAPDAPVAEHLRHEVFAPWVTAFADGTSVPGVSREGLYQRVMMVLSLDTCLRG